jgi:hypothetical protein
MVTAIQAAQACTYRQALVVMVRVPVDRQRHWLPRHLAVLVVCLRMDIAAALHLSRQTYMACCILVLGCVDMAAAEPADRGTRLLMQLTAHFLQPPSMAAAVVPLERLVPVVMLLPIRAAAAAARSAQQPLSTMAVTAQTASVLSPGLSK